MIGARQFTEHERVEPIRLAAAGPEPRPRGGDLVGMQRQHPQPDVKQPLDQQPIRPLDRDQRDLEPHQRATQQPEPVLVVREAAREQPLAHRVRDQHVVLLRRPIDAGASTHQPLHDHRHDTTPRPRGASAIAYRQALTRGYVLLPLTAPRPAGTGWS